MQFAEDARYQQIAEAYAQDAVDFAQSNLSIRLDWSDTSIEMLESILDRFHSELARARPTDEQIAGYSKMWGSYLGEVYRKNYGAVWGLVTHQGESIPGLQGTKGNLFWPWGRVENRLRDGAENNIWHYYLHLTGKL